jgi:cytochrome P450 family 6
MLDHESEETNPHEMIVNEDENIDSSRKSNNISKKTLTNAEILSQSFLFLTAGYETVATSLCFMAYNLSMSMQYQEKLIEEIDRVLEKYVSEFEILVIR